MVCSLGSGTKGLFTRAARAALLLAGVISGGGEMLAASCFPAVCRTAVHLKLNTATGVLFDAGALLCPKRLNSRISGKAKPIPIKRRRSFIFLTGDRRKFWGDRQ